MAMGPRVTALFLAVALAGAGGVQAQGPSRPLTVTGSQNLVFGAVIPGVPQTILRTDAAFAGRYEMRGSNRAEVRIEFTLPAAMAGPAGATLPLQFGAGDGGRNTENTIGTAVAFDPRVPLVTNLHANGRLYIWLGGTASPSGTQRSGNYTAVITLTASYTGN
jgi:hypothetical protein